MQDDEQARAQRAAERRRLAEAAANERLESQATLDEATARGLFAACAPQGWVFDPMAGYSLGMATFAAVCAVAIGVAFLLPDPDALVVMFGRTSLGPIVVGLFPFGVALIVPVVVRRFAMPGARRAAIDERRWLAALPFPIVGAESAYASARDKMRASVYFVDDPKHPPATRAQELVGTGGFTSSVSVHYSDELRIEIVGFVDREAADWKKGRAYRLAFHDLEHTVLSPLHAERAIERVELG